MMVAIVRRTAIDGLLSELWAYCTVTEPTSPSVKLVEWRVQR
jgi:hypothetical protein